MNRAIYARRRTVNGILLTLSTGAAVLGMVALALILGTLVINGAAGFSLKLFTMSTPAPGSEGGLANAIVGSAMLSGLAVLFGTPIGIMAGTYLAEYGRHTWTAAIVRFINDILLSAPSILIGLFIYELIVLQTQHYSGWAGVAALTVIVIPVVVRTSENMLLLVPNTLREAAASVGAPRSVSIRAVTWRAARAGMLTGVLLAVARITGETAPLIFTSSNDQFWSTKMSQPIASLSIVIYNFANSALDDWHRLAWAGALLITLTVLTLSVLARLLESSGK